MSEEEVRVDADGTTHFENADEPPPIMNEDPPMQEEAAGAAGAEGFGGTGGAEEDFSNAGARAGDEFAGAGEEAIVQKGIDPAIYLLIVVIIFLVGYFWWQRKKKEEEEDDFFSNLDGEKVRSK